MMGSRPGECMLPDDPRRPRTGEHAGEHMQGSTQGSQGYGRYRTYNDPSPCGQTKKLSE